MAWTIGRFTLDRQTRELRDDGNLIAIEARVFDFLVAIISHRDRVVGKEELIETVWSGRIVSDTAISSCLKSARAAVGDDGKQQRFIKTVHGKGYRFVADVQDMDVESPVSDTPTLQRDANSANNLPADRLALYGRHTEIAEICGLIHDNRMVSLLGIGGTGKTRLGIACGRDLLTVFDDGVWFVDLVPVNNAQGIDLAIAEAIGVTLTSAEPRQELAGRINGRRLLLILDNCEHISEMVSQAADYLLEHTSGPAMLATSREPLDLADEYRVNVEPLRVDGSGDFLDDAPLATGTNLAPNEPDARSPAAQLFCARAARLGIEIDAADFATVRAICTHLDGLPLAIELAAAQLRQLQLSELSARLDKRFDLLAGQQRPGSERQASLLNVLADTWEMLENNERKLLSQLAIFPGLFSVTDIEELIDENPELVVSRVFGRLVDRSLVRREGAHWRLLETVRLFAQRQMTADERQQFADAHASWCLDRVGDSMQQHCYSRTLANWCTGHFNDLRTARDHKFGQSEYGDAARIMAAQSYALHRDDGTRAAAALREIGVYLAKVNDTALTARLHFTGVLAAMAARSPEQIELHAEAGLNAAQESGNATLQAAALVWLSWATVFKDIDEALKQVRQASQLALEAGDDQTRDLADSYTACHLGLQRNYAEAADLARIVVSRTDQGADPADYPVHCAGNILASVTLIDNPEEAYDAMTTKGDNLTPFSMWTSKLLTANCQAYLGQLQESAAICAFIQEKFTRSGLSALPDLLIPASYMAYGLGEIEQARTWLRTVKEAGQPTQSFQMTITYRRLRETVDLSAQNPLVNQTLEAIGAHALAWMQEMGERKASSVTRPRLADPQS